MLFWSSSASKTAMRFHRQTIQLRGRMLPRASRTTRYGLIRPALAVSSFMEAPHLELLNVWTRSWDDLVDSKSLRRHLAEFWAGQQLTLGAVLAGLLSCLDATRPATHRVNVTGAAVRALKMPLATSSASSGFSRWNREDG